MNITINIEAAKAQIQSEMNALNIIHNDLEDQLTALREAQDELQNALECLDAAEVELRR